MDTKNLKTLHDEDLPVQTGRGIQRTLILILLLIVLPLMAAQTYIYYDRLEAGRNRELQANLELARIVARAFEAFVKDVVHHELAIGLAVTSRQPISSEDITRLLGTHTDFAAVREFSWLSPEGVFLYSSNSALVGANNSDRAYFREIANGREWTVGELVLARITGGAVFAISRGIRDGKGTLLGVIVATVVPEQLDSVLSIERGKGGGYAIVDHKGMLVYRHPALNATWEERNWLRDFPEFGEALQGREIAKTVYAPYEGKNRLVGFTSVPSIGWAASAGRTEEDAMGPATSVLKFHIMVFLTVLLAAFGVATYFSRSIAAAIKKLQDHAIALGRGETEKLIVPNGPVELQNLSYSLNRMAEMMQSRFTALSESEERYRALIDASSQVLYRMSPDWGEMRRLQGGNFVADTEEPNSNWVQEYIHPDDRKRVLEAIGKAMQTGTSFTLEHRVRRVDGTLGWTFSRAVPLRNAAGEIVEWFGAASDITERKLAEEALVESERKAREQAARLQATLDAAPVLIWMAHDRESRFISGNKAAQEISRVDQTVNMSKTCPEPERLSHYRICKDGRELAPEELPIQIVARTGKELRDYSFEFVLEDGTEYSLLGNVIPVLNAEGKPDGAVAAFLDVSEYKRAEQEIRELSQRLNYHVENSPLAVIEWGPDMRLIRWSGEAERMFGWRADEVTGRRMEDFRWICEDDEARVAEVSEELRTGTSPQSFSANRNYRKDGSVIHCEWYNSSLVDDSGNLRSILSLVLDVTKRKEAENALKESEIRFRLLSETATRLLMTDNPQGIVNELCRNVMDHLECHAFFNFLVDETAGKLHLNACAGIPEEEARNIEWLDFGVAVCGCAAQGKVRIIAEDIFHTPDIRTELVKSYGIQAYACHPLLIQDHLIGTLSFGTKSRISFSSDDLALMKTVADQVATAMERMRLIEALKRSRDELEIRVEERTARLQSYMAKLERSNQALEDFASIASHDLQEPLRKVTSFGNLLKQEHAAALGETGKDYLNRMLNATDRMRNLLNALLDFARITTKAEPFVQVDLGLVVREVLSDLEVRIEKTGGEVLVGELPTLEADPTQMRQLFQNLIGNALKFHKEDEKPIVKVFCGKDNGESCTITVEDNGIGFEEEHLDRIFAPFHRLHSRSGPYEGTGMGLAICKKIVERHGGSITARSTPGQGAAFIVALPERQSG